MWLLYHLSSTVHHPRLVPLHPGVLLSLCLLCVPCPPKQTADIKAERGVARSFSRPERMSWENDPARGRPCPRTTWSHLRGEVSAFHWKVGKKPWRV